MTTIETYASGNPEGLIQGETADTQSEIEECVELVTETVSQLILVAYATKNKDDPILPTIFLILDVGPPVTFQAIKQATSMVVQIAREVGKLYLEQPEIQNKIYEACNELEASLGKFDAAVVEKGRATLTQRYQS